MIFRAKHAPASTEASGTVARHREFIALMDALFTVTEGYRDLNSEIRAFSDRKLLN